MMVEDGIFAPPKVSDTFLRLIKTLDVKDAEVDNTVALPWYYLRMKLIWDFELFKAHVTISKHRGMVTYEEFYFVADGNTVRVSFHDYEKYLPENFKADAMALYDTFTQPLTPEQEVEAAVHMYLAGNGIPELDKAD